VAHAGINKIATRFMVSSAQSRREHTKLAATRCKPRMRHTHHLIHNWNAAIKRR